MRRHGLPLLLLALLLLPGAAAGYPLDGAAATGILRLEGYRLAQAGKVPGHRLPPGATLLRGEVDLRLLAAPQLEIPAADPDFSREVRALLGADAERYGLAVLDLTDPERPRYAEHRGKALFNPGSVGKLVVALALFQALADLHPENTLAREELLRTTLVTADETIRVDRHEVPFWDEAAGRIVHRPVRVGDTVNLWGGLDWMLSASSNAAASMVMKELMLLRRFGRDYPVNGETAARFFRETPKAELGELLARALQEPLARNGLDVAQLRQGKFFTWKGQELVPGPSSHAGARELLRFLLLLEQGRLVDPFSSRELKRLLYLTQRRIRYASAPALAEAALCFKSGSLYECREEAGFRCGKYQGNVVNMMNSVAIVEAPAKERRLFYLVVVMSNVLRVNSAVAHQSLATRLHRLIEASARAGRERPEEGGTGDR